MTRFTYQPTREDFLRLNRRLYPRQLRILGLFAAANLLVFAAYPWAARTGFGVQGTYYSALGLLALPILVGLLVGALEWSARKRWQSSGEIRAPRTYEIDETGIRVTSATFNGFLSWEHIAESREAGGFLYLRTRQSLHYYFPLALVPDPTALRALVAAKTAPSPAQRGRFSTRTITIWWVIIIGVVVTALQFRTGGK